MSFEIVMNVRFWRSLVMAAGMLATVHAETMAQPDASATDRLRTFRPGHVFTPAPSSPERKAILDAIRSGQERFTIQTMRVALTPKGGAAYVTADSGGASAVRALLVRSISGRWTPILLMGDGSQTCDKAMQAQFQRIGARVGRHGVDVDRVMPGFARLVEEIGEADGLDCLPDVVFPDGTD